MPRVSVVIPTYNRVDVLPRAISSVLDQTMEDFELIVVDDGSTDDTQSYIGSIDDSRIRSIAHGTNQGANAARNTGIDAANGSYVAFLDSDDEWKPTKLERQLELLDERSDEWIAAYCDAELHVGGATGRVEMIGARLLARTASARRVEGGEELMGEILADNVQPGAGSTLVVRTEIARRVGGFDESLNRFQDPEFVLRILEEGKVAYVDEPLVIRYDTGSPTPDLVETADKQYLSTYADRIEALEAAGYDIRGSHNLVLAKAHLSNGNFRAGGRYLFDSSVVPRHVPGVMWAVGSGIRARPRTAIGVGILIGLGLLSWLAFGS